MERTPAPYFDPGQRPTAAEQSPRSALAAFGAASELRKDSGRRSNNQGLVLYELGRRDQAIERLARCLKINATAAEADLLPLATALPPARRVPPNRPQG